MKDSQMRNGQAGVRRSHLTPEEVTPIGAYGAKANWPPGFQLYQRGVPADGVFIVLEGHVILRNKIKVGRGFVPVIATAGQTFVSEGLSPNSHYVTDANASEETKTMFPVSYTHLRAHETRHDIVCRLLLEKKKRQQKNTQNEFNKKKNKKKTIKQTNTK